MACAKSIDLSCHFHWNVFKACLDNRFLWYSCIFPYQRIDQSRWQSILCPEFGSGFWFVFQYKSVCLPNRLVQSNSGKQLKHLKLWEQFDYCFINIPNICDEIAANYVIKMLTSLMWAAQRERGRERKEKKRPQK